MIDKKYLFVISLILSLSFISALTVNIPIPIQTIVTNYSSENVNNSIYWQGHTGTDGSWLTGIGDASYQFLNNNFNGSGNLTGRIIKSSNGSAFVELDASDNNDLRTLHSDSTLYYKIGTTLVGYTSTTLAYSAYNDKTFRLGQSGTNYGYMLYLSATDTYNIGTAGTTTLKLISPYINFTGDFYSHDKTFYFNTTSNNLNITGNITAVVYHGNIDWINVPISLTLTGTTACTNLNNLVAGYSYTCQTCVDSLVGTQIACGTIASVMENCACKVN